VSASSESRSLISESPRPNLRAAHPHLSSASPPEAAPSLPGITLRPEPLARSPRAVIYRGWDRPRRRRVIVKVQRATDDPVTVSRFGREGAVMLRLRHPSIVTLYAFHPGDAAKNDPAALVLEYVSGTTLAALVAADGWLPPERAVRIIEDIAAALDCVHALGVVHRDIKPSNILLPSSFLLPRRGPAKLTDFGVARMDGDLPLTVMGDILGTVEYASPEQVNGNGAVDACSDVYSLAAVTYFALTGTPPFRAADASTQSQLSVMHRQVFSSPPPLRLHRDDLSPALEEAVLRGLAKTPDARYASAGQLAAALRAALAASAGQPQQKAMEASARRTGVLAGAAAGAVLLAGFALLAVKTGVFRPRLTTPPSSVAGSQGSIPQHITEQDILPTLSVSHAAPKQAAAKTAHAKTAHAKTAPSKAGQRAVLAVPLPKPRPPRVVSAKLPARKPLRLVAAPKPRRLLVPLFVKSANSVKTAAPRVRPVRASPAAETGAGWYAVSGWIALSGQSSQKPQIVHASPLWIKVDGHPLPQLASGQWAILPTGNHQVTFQPAAGLGAGPKTWTIKIAPSGHLSQQVSLPPAPLPEIPTHLRNP